MRWSSKSSLTARARGSLTSPAAVQSRKRIEPNAHQPLVTTRALLVRAGRRDLADLLPLEEYVDRRIIGYWTTTAIISVELLAGGTADLVRGGAVLVAGQPVVDVLAHLGYPAYLLNILGVWKLLGAMALLAPGLPRLKEWAYAGTVFELTGALASSVANGDSSVDLLGSGFLAMCAVVSWALRPQSRTLGVLISARTPGPHSAAERPMVLRGD
jgi:hypothetical protein